MNSHTRLPVGRQVIASAAAVGVFTTEGSSPEKLFEMKAGLLRLPVGGQVAVLRNDELEVLDVALKVKC